MKNLTNRNKIMLVIAGVLVVAAMAIAIFTQVGGGELLGATALVITPSNPTIVHGNTVGLSVNATYNCTWKSSDTSAASLVNYSGETKSVTVKGNAAGSATITANCGLGALNVNQVTTTVTVYPVLAISTSDPKDGAGATSVKVGDTKVLYVPNVYTCNWSSSNTAVVSFPGGTSGWWTTVKGDSTNIGNSTVTAQCGTWGSASISVSVSNPSGGGLIGR